MQKTQNGTFFNEFFMQKRKTHKFIKCACKHAFFFFTKKSFHQWAFMKNACLSTHHFIFSSEFHMKIQHMQFCSTCEKKRPPQIIKWTFFIWWKIVTVKKRKTARFQKSKTQNGKISKVKNAKRHFVWRGHFYPLCLHKSSRLKFRIFDNFVSLGETAFHNKILYFWWTRVLNN